MAKPNTECTDPNHLFQVYMLGYNLSYLWLENWQTRDVVQVQWFINLFAAVVFVSSLSVFVCDWGFFRTFGKVTLVEIHIFEDIKCALFAKRPFETFKNFSSQITCKMKIITIPTWLYLKMTFVTNSVILRLSPIFLKYLNIQNMLNFTG